MTSRALFVAAVGWTFVISTLTLTGQTKPTRTEPRFDELVRADFFAGVAGDAAALDRAMRLIESTLADDPGRPDVLVWHGSGLVLRAGQAAEKGDAATSDTLLERGLQEMNEAVGLEPDNVAVLIPRGATLLELSRSMPDAGRAKTLLATAVSDYERVLVLQAPYFKYLSEHSRGELLFGLAEGLHRLGERERSRMYFTRLLDEARNSSYESMARAWLNDSSGASTRQRGCVGCHQSVQTQGAQGWNAITERLESAALKGAQADLRAIRASLIGEVPRSTEQRTQSRVQYTIAYIGWRMSTLPDVSRTEQDLLLGDAAERLEAVLKVNPSDVEALALVGTIYGQQAGRSSLKAIVLGPRSMGTLERAATMAAANPRVLLLQGIASLNTPPAYGGSRDKAEQLLRRSLDEFSREPQSKTWPNWGRFDAHAWLGQALRRKADLAGARAEYTKALEIAPESRWVRVGLLPALDRASQR